MDSGHFEDPSKNLARCPLFLTGPPHLPSSVLRRVTHVHMCFFPKRFSFGTFGGRIKILRQLLYGLGSQRSKSENKHCQRHNGPRVQHLRLELSLQLNRIPLALVLPDGTTCISCKFDHQMVPLALVAKLATRWRYLHELKIWPQDSTVCISCNINHKMAPLA